MIGSAGLDGTIGCMAVDGATTRDVFREYVQQALRPSPWSGGIVVVDDLPAHKDGESEAF